MGLFYLLTMYCSVRALDRQPARWHAAAILACAAGMACKESMLTAPVIVGLYDYVFVASPVLRKIRRARLYIGLAMTWLVLAALMWSGPRETVGLNTDVSPWTYLLNQAPMLLIYLRESFWPRQSRPRLRRSAAVGADRRLATAARSRRASRPGARPARSASARRLPRRMVLHHAVAHIELRSNRDGSRRGAAHVSPARRARRAGRLVRVSGVDVARELAKPTSSASRQQCSCVSRSPQGRFSGTASIRPRSRS